MDRYEYYIKLPDLILLATSLSENRGYLYSSIDADNIKFHTS